MLGNQSRLLVLVCEEQCLRVGNGRKKMETEDSRNGVRREEGGEVGVEWSELGWGGAETPLKAPLHVRRGPTTKTNPEPNFFKTQGCSDPSLGPN